MIGHAVLGSVVRANLLGTVARANLRQALSALGRLLLGKHLLVETRTQNSHCGNLVLQLRLLVLRLNHKAAGKVRDAHSGVGRVNALTTRAACAIHIDAQIVLIDVDLDLVGLRKHGDRSGRRMNAALAFRLRNALHAVHAALELHDGINLVALHLELDFLIAASIGGAHIHGFGLPALRVAEAQVHLVQIARENGGLVATGGSTNLDDDVFLIGGIARNEHVFDFLFKRRKLRFSGSNSFLGKLAHVGIVEHFLRIVDVVARLKVFASLGHKRALVGIFLGELGVFSVVVQNRRVGKLVLELLVASDDLLEPVSHGSSNRLICRRAAA